MSQPTYGVTINEAYTAPRPVLQSDFSTGALVLPRDDADLTKFPSNQPVVFNSSDTTFLSKMGSGDFAKAVLAIDNQLESFQAAARIVAVLVPNGADKAGTTANIVGSPNNSSGIYALLTAGPRLGIIPRLVASPGYTGHSLNGINLTTTITNRGSAFTSAPDVAFSGGAGSGAAASTTISKGILSVAITTGGTGYTTAPTLTVAPPAAGGAAATLSCTVASGAITAVTVVDKGHGYGPSEVPVITVTGAGTGAVLAPTMTGVLESITITNVGTGYTSAPTMAISGGAGSGATATCSVNVYANQICSALPAVLNQLLAVAIVGGPGTGVVADDVGWRQTINDERLILADAWVVPSNGIGYTDGAAEGLGLFVRVDYQRKGLPFWSVSGQQVKGIAGLKNYFSFSLTDGANDSQTLLSNQISVISQGQIGSDTAIDSAGFVWAGTWNSSTDSNKWFYNKRRGKDFVHLSLIKSMRKHLGVENVTPHSVQSVMNDMTELGSFLIGNQISLGFKVTFVPDENSATQLQQGKFVLGFANEIPAPINLIGINSTDFFEALEVELATIIAQSNTLVPQFIN